MTLATPGWASSARAVDLAALERLVDGVFLGDRKDAEDLPRLRPSTPLRRLPATAKSSPQESVMGSGQKSPFSRRISRHAPRQSAAPMKPSSGV